MKVTTEIDVTPEQYFRHLCNGVIKDVKKATDRTVTVAELMDGYVYEHSVRMKNREIIIKLTVGPLIKDKYFQVKYETRDTTCLYYYDFSTENGKNYVTYCEENNYNENTLGNKLSNFRRSFRKKALINRIFNNIELTTTYIKNHEL